MAKVSVLLTLFEHPVEVLEDEVESLRRQGLLREVLGEKKPDSKAGTPGTPPSDTGKEGTTS